MRRSRKLSAVLEEAKKAFKLDPGRTLHGPEHWEQVERNAIELGKNTPGCDIEVARLFAILHDCKRENEANEKGHGRRAAAFARELHERGMLAMDPERLAMLLFAIKHHNDGRVSSDPTTGVCWDADRLDLPRVGIAPAAGLLSTRYARERLQNGIGSNGDRAGKQASGMIGGTAGIEASRERPQGGGGEESLS